MGLWLLRVGRPWVGLCCVWDEGFSLLFAFLCFEIRIFTCVCVGRTKCLVLSLELWVSWLVRIQEDQCRGNRGLKGGTG